MISPAPNGIPEFVRPLTVGLAISVGYVAAHFVLSLLSTKLEIAHNISVWYLPGGLLFGCLMAARGSQVWWVLIGDVAARTLWAVGVYGHPALMAVALVISPLVYGSVTTFLKSPRIGAGFGSSTAVMWLLIGMVTAPAIAAPLNCLNYAFDGVFRWADLGTIIPSFLIGDLVGIGTLVPLILAAATVALPKRIEAMAVVRTILLPVVAALVLFAAFHSERPEIYTSAKFLMFVPLTVVALRDGWRGAAVAIVILNFTILLTLPTHQVPIAAIEIQLLLLSYSLFALILGVVIQERRDTQQENELLAAAAHSSPNALGIIDLTQPEQRFLFVNDALMALAGRTADELRQASWRDLHGDSIDLVRLEQCAARLLSRQTVEVEMRMARAGETRIVLARGGPVDHGGQSRAYLMTYFDITTDKQREQIEREREKLISLGQLAGGVAHELNNLLHPIINYSKLAAKRLEGDQPRIRHYLNGINTCGIRAGEIVQKVLLFARHQPLNRIPVVLGEAVAGAVDLIRTRVPPTVSLGLIITAQGQMARLDTTEVTQIVTNLVLNAVHAVTKDGRIDITVSAVVIEQGGTSDAAIPPGPYLRLMVADNGHGIDDTTRGRIFDPFFSTKPIGEGTGLGLSVVFGIVTAVGGAITVDSELGKGAAFSVYLPEVSGASKE